jgi:hypothetical protein
MSKYATHVGAICHPGDWFYGDLMYFDDVNVYVDDWGVRYNADTGKSSGGKWPKLDVSTILPLDRPRWRVVK